MTVSVHVSAGGGMLGLSSVKPGSDGHWTVTQISCHSGIFYLSFCQHITFLFFLSLCITVCHDSNPQGHTGYSFKENCSHEKCKCLCSEINLDSCDPDLIFIFPFVSPPLCQIWWLIWTFLLLMKVSWQHALQMKRWDFFPLSLYWSCFCILTHKSTFHPLRLCCSWQCQCSEYDMNLLGFFWYLNLLKTHSSQHIILSHRCPSLLGIYWVWVRIFRLSSSVYLREPHTWPSGLQCPASAAHFHSSYLLPSIEYFYRLKLN